MPVSIEKNGKYYLLFISVTWYILHNLARNKRIRKY